MQFSIDRATEFGNGGEVGSNGFAVGVVAGASIGFFVGGPVGAIAGAISGGMHGAIIGHFTNLN